MPAAPVTCPRCHAELDAATLPANPEQRPRAGDVSVCGYCLNLAVFTGSGFELRVPTSDELDELEANPEVAEMVQAIGVAHSKVLHPAAQAPCGCLLIEVGPTFLFQPCSPTCDTYAQTVDRLRIAGTPIELVGPRHAR